jgi:arginyl-tRNA synthetase
MLEDLIARGQITDDKGAKCIFVPKRKVPLMVQKSDGGYGYDTTDLAALRFRANEEKADWIIYVTDEGQKLHFDTVIDAGKQVGYMDPAKTRYDHVGFGLVLQVMGEEAKDDGKEESKKPKIGKMKTREGDTTKLMDLLDEARNRTLEIFRARMKEDDEEGVDRKVQVDETQLE